jgi:ABC-type multidrug transport system ATPase subunit
MKVILENIGRHFNREWIFKNINYTFEATQSYAILGANGSGKSTLLQLIAGNLSPSTGRVDCYLNDEVLDNEQLFNYVSLAAPYLELIEEFTLEESIHFHFQFKNCLPNLDPKAIMDLLDLKKSAHKTLKYFSSGMKQRVKLALAFCSDTPLLLLDEPTANLDQQGIHWYVSLIEQFSNNRLTIICSNQEQEYQFCKHQILLSDYKQ